MTPETIAIVEDDAAIWAVLKVALKSAGYSLVCEAERGDEGLRLMREQKPSLVLLDVMMPGLDGFEVLKRLRDGKDTASIPVILLTAKSEEADVVRGLELGADDYVTKWSSCERPRSGFVAWPPSAMPRRRFLWRCASSRSSAAISSRMSPTRSRHR